MAKNKLTREEYKNKFDELFSKMNYIPQAGEEIVQCKEGYPEYWFISNRGYIFSVYRNEIEILKPIFDTTGKANKEGKRAGRSWRYGTREGGKKNLTRYDMGKMMTDHFGKNEFNSNEETEIHHITKRNNFSEYEAQKCNSSDNLQILPKSIHKELTQIASKTSDEHDKDIEKKVIKSGCPVYGFTEEGLEKFLIQAIRSCLANGVEPIIYTTTITDDVSQIKAEAHPVKSIEFDSVDEHGNTVKVTEKTNFKKTMEKIDSMMK